MKPLSVCAALMLLATACASAPSEGPAPAPEKSTSKNALTRMRDDADALARRFEMKADYVEVQHLLVSFAGAGTDATRTQQEAENLAAELYGRIMDGADFDALVLKYTDDSHPGIYGMVQDRSDENMKENRYYRRNMVAAFGDTGWRLNVGEVGVAVYNSQTSPYGWHIIKRLK